MTQGDSRMTAENYDIEGENFEEPTLKERIVRTGLMVVLVVAVAAGAVTAVNWWGARNEQNKEPASVAMSDTEKTKVATTAELFLSKTGNFGVVSGTVDQQGDNVITVANTVSTAPEKYPSLFITRQMAYRNALPVIAKGSPAYMDGVSTSKWSNETDLGYLMGFELKDSKVQPADKASYITLNGKRVLAVKAKGTFSSRVTMRVQNGNDVDWDGTYTVQSRGFSDQPVEFTLVQVDGTWLVFSVDKLEHPFLLANWKNPIYAGYDLKDYKVTSSIQTTRGLGGKGQPNQNSSLTPEQAQNITPQGH